MGMVQRAESESESVSVVRTDAMASYHLKTTRFEYDTESNHRRQCLRSMHEFEVCLERVGEEAEGDVEMELTKGKGIKFPAQHFVFSEDGEWDEVTRRRQSQSECESVMKCVHAFEAKICIERMKSDSNDAFEFVVSVMIQQTDSA